MTITEKCEKLNEKPPKNAPPAERAKDFDDLLDEGEGNGSKKEKKTAVNQDKNEDLENLKIEIKKTLPFHILGFNSKRQILIWYKGRIIHHPVNSLNKDDLTVYVGRYEDPGSYKALKQIVLDEAHIKGVVDDEAPISSGLWRIKEEGKDEWIIVSGREAAKIHQSGLEISKTPIINDRIIQFQKEKWINLQKLKETLQKTEISKTFNELKKLVSQWVWADDDMVNFVTAFVMLSPFQNAMKWKPWIYFLGDGGTGKSSFFEYVFEKLFGCLVKRIDKGTAHSTAQYLGNSCRIGIFDEFEKNKKIDGILELLKLCNGGGNYTRGTTSENPREYSMFHMPFLASITLPKTFRTDRAQLSRVIKFNLKKKPEGKNLVGLTDSQADNLCLNIISSVISSWDQIDQMAKDIEEKKQKYVNDCEGKIDGRCVENFMYALALIEVATGQKRGIPEWAIEEIKEDSINILETIINSKIRYKNEEFVVVDLIHKALKEPIILESDYCEITDTGAKDLLRKHGLSTVLKSGSWYLAIIPHEVSKCLLKNDDDFKNIDIKPFIQRLSGVHKDTIKTEWGEQNKRRALHIPGDHINALCE